MNPPNFEHRAQRLADGLVARLNATLLGLPPRTPLAVCLRLVFGADDAEAARGHRPGRCRMP